MKDKRMKSKPCGDFFESTIKHFQFLINEYGFKHISSKRISYDCTVNYKNQMIGIQVWHEMMGPVGVILNRPVHKNNEHLEITRIDMLQVVKLQNQSYYEELRQKPYPRNKEELNNLILEYSETLKKYASAILNGDLTLFNEVIKLREEQGRNA